VVLVFGVLVVFGGATTGAGGVVVGAGAEVVVWGAADVVTGGGVVVWVVDAVVAAGLRTAALWGCTALWVVVVVVDDVVVVEDEVAGLDAAAFELVCEAEPPPQPEIANPATIMPSNAFFINATPVRLECSAFRLQDTPGAGTFRRRRAQNGHPVARSAACSG